MRRPVLLAAIAAVTFAAAPIGLFACSERRAPQMVKEDLKAFSVAESPPVSAMRLPAMERPAPPPASPTPGQPQQDGLASAALVPQTAPKIAYSYGYRFKIPAARLAAVQERHLQLCRDLGEARCRIVSMRHNEQGRGRGAEAAAGQDVQAAALELQIATTLAARFGQQLTASAGEAGGETVDRQIAADDVSRQMVDSEARIRTRETLIRRLSALLETRSGNIDQAVAAERAINQAQEELDAARNWLAETRGRVIMSQVAIVYEPDGDPVTPARGPFAGSFEQIGAITVNSLAALLLILGAMLPWAVLGLGLFYLARWHRRRRERGGADLAPSLPS